MHQIICILFMIAGMMACIEVCQNRAPKKVRKVILTVVFCTYCFGNLYATVLSRNVGYDAQVELMPFHTYFELFDITESDRPIGNNVIAVFLKGTPPIVGLILNILLYYPLGYLLAVMSPQLKPKYVILIGCLCSIVTEASQYILKIGWCEMDDVIHNTLGTALGVWLWHLQSKRLNKPKSNELPKE